MFSLPFSSAVNAAQTHFCPHLPFFISLLAPFSFALSQPCRDMHPHAKTNLKGFLSVFLALCTVNEQCNPRFQCAGQMLVSHCEASIKLSLTEWQRVQLCIRGMSCVLYVELCSMALRLGQNKLGSTTVESPSLWIFAHLQFHLFFFSPEFKFWVYTRKCVYMSGQQLNVCKKNILLSLLWLQRALHKVWYIASSDVTWVRAWWG